MQLSLQVFEYEDRREFRVIEIDGQPWFVLADVCRTLDLADKKGYFGHHADRLDDDEKRVVQRSELEKTYPPLRQEGGLSGSPTINVVNESGLWSLILRSDKPGAKRLKKWVTSEVLPSIRRTGGYQVAGRAPAFIRRFNENWDRVSPGFFSVLNELTVRLYGRFEMLGYVMADRSEKGEELRPDVSVGRTFAEHLRAKHPDRADDFGYYIHKTPEWEGQVRQYPLDLLPLYIEFVETVWIPEYGPAYFGKRDPIALTHLPKLLPMTHRARPGAMRGMLIHRRQVVS